MKNRIIQDITEKICNVKLKNGFYPDGYIDDHPYYIQILEHIKENKKVRLYFKTEGYSSPEKYYWELATKIIATSFAMGDADFLLEAKIIEVDLVRNLEKLSLEELAEIFSFWFSDNKWEGEYKATDDFIKFGKEKIKAESAVEMLKTIILLKIDKNLDFLKSFLNHETKRQFWYKLLGSKSEDTEFRIKHIIG